MRDQVRQNEGSGPAEFPQVHRNRFPTAFEYWSTDDKGAAGRPFVQS